MRDRKSGWLPAIADGAFLVEAWFEASRTGFALRLGRLAIEDGGASAPPRSSPPARDEREDARLRRWVALFGRAAGRSVPRIACLGRSLALRRLLARRGVETALRIGFRREGGRVEGHAWLEREGLVLGDAPDVAERFPARPDAAVTKAGSPPGLFA